MRLSGVLSLGDGRSWNVALGLTLAGNREDFVFFEEDIEPIGLPPGPSDRLAVQSLRQLRDRDAYRLITVERRLAYGKAGIGEGSRLEPLAGRDHVPPELTKLLFDMRQERAPSVERFLEALQRFKDLLPGTPDLQYKRHEDRARIVFDAMERKGPPLASHLLGAGTQQIIALLGQASVARVPILAIEEPERGLRYALQIRARDALLTLLSSSAEQTDQFQQLFITSHTDAFEEPADDATFYALSRGPDGPQVAQRSKKVAAQFVGLMPLT